MREAQLVERLASIGWRGSRGVVLGPGDDAAVLRGGLVVSTDLCVEGVHYRSDWISAREAGFRAGAAALSDLAAMGATPTALLVSLALLGDPREAVDIQQGIRRAGDRVTAPIIGGDVSRSLGGTAVDVVAIGRSPRPVLRRGAGAGERLWVSGSLGGAAAAVSRWSRGLRPSAAARARFAAPPDRVRLGALLAERGLARSMIDVSDGLMADVARIAKASVVRITVRRDRVPVDVQAGADQDLALAGGEDYELVFTAPQSADHCIREVARECSVALTQIGVVAEGTGVVLEDARGSCSPPVGGGFDHFAGPTGVAAEGGGPASARISGRS